MPSIVFAILCMAFLIYSGSIYIYGASASEGTEFKAEAGNGKLVWQKYNCQGCHQMYGLGGYLGPDLTNVSSKWQNDTILEAVIRSGNERMPSYHGMDRKNMKALLVFLREMDASGTADPRNFRREMNGMIYRNENRN